MSATTLARIGTILVLAVLLAAGPAMAADQRVALLIGNNAYTATPLQNAVNDARDLGAALQKLGFTVIVKENASRRDMIDALREFGGAIDRAEAAVFFYAGHALQFKDRNYLVPVDGEMRSEEDIALFSVELQQVFDRMDKARTRTNVIILDACRDNPFASSFKVSSPGLAQANAPSGTLIAYATAPGSVAADGYGRNGMYTKHVLQHIATADLPVEILFKRVREGVERETQRRQTPWDVSSLKGEFQFAVARSAAAAPAATAVQAAGKPSVDVQLQIERDFWISVRDTNRPEELQAYLDEYPEGKFAALARIRLRSIGTAVPGGLQVNPQNQILPAGPMRMTPRSIAPEEGKAPDKSSQLGWRLFPAAVGTEPAPPKRPSVEEIFRKAQFDDIQLSPDGRYIAVIAPVAGRQNVAILELGKRGGRVVTSFEDRDVAWIRWISNKRLLIQTESVLDQLSDARMGGLAAVDADGTDARRISGNPEEAGGTGRLVLRPFLFVTALPGDTDDFIAQEYAGGSDGRVSSTGVYRVNSRSGRRTLLTIAKPDNGETESWVFDKAGVPRVFVAERRGAKAIYYRAGPDAPWVKLDETPVGTPGWEPLGIAGDGRSIYARSWRGRDRAAIVLMEPVPGAAPQVIASHPYVDVKDLVYDNAVPVGVAYDADRPGFAWWDEELERIQGTVDAALPRSTNVLSWSRNRERVLVRSSSDVSAGTFYLFDRTTGRIEYLADRKGWLKADAMSPMKPVRYRARDGLDIPAYLTLPRADTGGKLPLVVLVHGGPWTEGYSWGFQEEVQHLASLGYAVLQPNFRGTLRYGWKHFRSGFKQWGHAMQEDLADGVAWAVQQGYVDKDRVCVAGANYGGYAAVMGLAATPGTFRCAVSFAGFTDPALFFDSGFSPLANSDFMRFSARELIGDPDKDRDLLARASPVRQADKIRAPVLLGVGGFDIFVPVSEASRLRSAIEGRGNQVEWLQFDDEINTLRKPANRLRFHEAVEKFLAASLRSP